MGYNIIRGIRKRIMPRIRLLKKKKHRLYHGRGNRKLRQKIYNDPRWQALRNDHIMHHPLCQDCLDGVCCQSRVTPATEVHHIIPFSEGFEGDKITQRAEQLAYDPDNLVSLCQCHHLYRHGNLHRYPEWWIGGDDFMD